MRRPPPSPRRRIGARMADLDVAAVVDCGREEERMSGDLVRFELSEHVAQVTINRPESRNALNWEAYRQLQAAFERAQADPEVRCVLLTATDPSFCSGDDVKEIMAGPA